MGTGSNEENLHNNNPPDEKKMKRIRLDDMAISFDLDFEKYFSSSSLSDASSEGEDDKDFGTKVASITSKAGGNDAATVEVEKSSDGQIRSTVVSGDEQHHLSNPGQFSANSVATVII